LTKTMPLAGTPGALVGSWMVLAIARFAIKINLSL
jgi:hypothetical protein